MTKMLLVSVSFSSSAFLPLIDLSDLTGDYIAENLGAGALRQRLAVETSDYFPNCASCLSVKLETCILIFD